jgi:hypothetical protein
VLTTYEEQIEMDEDFIPQETSYRKGYYNGYERAVLDLQAMIREGFQPEQAIMASLEFVIADLLSLHKSILENDIYTLTIV